MSRTTIPESPHISPYSSKARMVSSRVLFSTSSKYTLTKAHVYVLIRVRSPFTTNQYEQIHPSLLDFSKTSYIPLSSGLPSVGHYTPKDLQPCLSEIDLTRIDGFLSTFRYPAPSEEVKKQVRVPAGQTNPCAFVAKYMHPQFTQAIKRECHGCGTLHTFEELKYCEFGVLFALVIPVQTDCTVNDAHHRYGMLQPFVLLAGVPEGELESSQTHLSSPLNAHFSRIAIGLRLNRANFIVSQTVYVSLLRSVDACARTRRGGRGKLESACSLTLHNFVRARLAQSDRPWESKSGEGPQAATNSNCVF